MMGYTRLDIQIPDEPTERHYDPENASFLVMVPELGMDRLVVSHPWRGPRRWQLLAGRIILQDRREKIIEAFSFGGDLRIEVAPGLTFCAVNSPAPILPLDRLGDPLVMIASEIEALMAIYRTAWQMDDEGFFTCLSEVDPADLFFAGLLEVQARFSRLPVRARGAGYWEAWNEVENTLTALEKGGGKAHPVQTFQELLEKFCD
jgi:hypothetical protein